MEQFVNVSSLKYRVKIIIFFATHLCVMTALSWREERSVAGARARARVGEARVRTAAAARPAPVRTRRPGTAAAVASLSAKHTNMWLLL